MTGKTSTFKKVLSLILAVSMIAALLLPTTAAVPQLTAKASVIELADGQGSSKVVEIALDVACELAATAALDNDIIVAGKTFGTGATAALSADGMTLTITLGEGSDIAMNDVITFANDVLYDAATPADVFNGDVEIASGTFDAATIVWNVEPAGATVEAEGYAAAPTAAGIGTINYTVSAENYASKSGTLEIAEADLGSEIKVDVALDADSADYSALTAAKEAAAALIEADYTPESYAAVKTALEAAEAVADDLTFEAQATISDAAAALNGAIAALVKWEDVSFVAVAVADDASVNYAKATKIMLVFSQPMEAGADILANLNDEIKANVSAGAWLAGTDNTVYELTIKADSALANDAAIAYTRNDAVKTETGAVMKDFATTVIGNLEAASEKVTATSMTATIVKGTEVPGVCDEDKIVLIFNAPILDNEATINVKTDDGVEFSAAAANESFTVYEIDLAAGADIEDSSTLTYENIADVALNGSFGNASAPRITRAYAVDETGTAAIYNEEKNLHDKIVVTFNMPTNGATIDLAKSGVITGTPGASLAGASYAWEEDNTRLVITLNGDEIVADGIKINLSGMGIKDKYGIVDAEISAIKVEGSFGYTIAPRVTKAVAFTQNNIDYIRVYFNTTIKSTSSKNVEFKLEGMTVDKSVVATIEGTDDFTYVELRMNPDDHTAFSGGTIELYDLVDKDTGKFALDTSPVNIKGAFVAPVKPEILRVFAMSNDGSGVPKAGDKIIAVFNIEIKEATEANVVAQNNVSFGTGSEVTTNGNIIEIILGEKSDVAPGKTQINFTGIKDEATESAEMDAITKTVEGSFGKLVEPEIMSATRISAVGNGIPGDGDKLVVVFNTEVMLNGQKGYSFELPATKDAYLIGSMFKTTVTSVTTGIEYKDLEKEITGSYGHSEEPKILKATRVSATGSGVASDGDKLVVVFNTEVMLDGQKGYYFELAATKDTYLIGSMFKTTVTSVETGKEYKDLEKEITGSYGFEIAPNVKSVVIVEKDTVETIYVTFDRETNGVNISTIKNFFDNNTHLGETVKGTMWNTEKTVLTIQLDDAATTTDSNVLNLSGLGICAADTGNGIAGLEALPITGTIIPVIEKEIVADGDKITIKFSARTNMSEKAIAKVSEQSYLFGTGATASWADNKTFVITVGEDHTLGKDAYITLNEFGITDEFSGNHAVVGQYKINTDKLNFTNLTITSVLAKAKEDSERTDTINAVAGDQIVVTFDMATNKAAATVSVAEGKSLGDYTVEWADDTTMFITLGEGVVFAAGDEITVSNVRFANGTGSIGNATNKVEGEFDGSKFWIVGAKANKINGRVRITAEILAGTDGSAKLPFVVCEAIDANTAVKMINAVGIASGTSKTNVIFDFDAKDIKNVKMFVVDGDYASSASELANLSAAKELSVE